MHFFDTPKHLNEHLQAGRRFLVCTDRQCFIAGEDAVFERQCGSDPTLFRIVDLERLWGLYQRMVEGKACLADQDIMRLARIDETVLRLWEVAGVVLPINESYSIEDGFAAAMCGSLRRKGVPVRVAHRAAKWVRTGQSMEARTR